MLGLLGEQKLGGFKMWKRIIPYWIKPELIWGGGCTVLQERMVCQQAGCSIHVLKLLNNIFLEKVCFCSFSMVFVCVCACVFVCVIHAKVLHKSGIQPVRHLPPLQRCHKIALNYTVKQLLSSQVIGRYTKNNVSIIKNHHH